MRPRRIVAGSRNVFAVVLVLASGAAEAQVVRGGFSVTDGTVRTMVRAGNTLYIGGTFNTVGPSTGCAVPIDVTSGAPVGVFPKIVGAVTAVAADGSGGWYLGGSFTEVAGTPRRNLAHVLADNTLAAWDPNPDGVVNVLAVAGGTVFVGGQFTSIGGQTRNGLAALDATTGLATAWDPNPDAPYIAVLARSGATLYAAGGFTSIGGQLRNGLAALDVTTGLATSWDPSPDGSVNALALSGETVYAGGYFSIIGGQWRNAVAALDSSTGLATAWNPSFAAPVNALAASGTSIYLAGDLSLAAFDATTGIADWSVEGSATALVLSGNTLYIGASGAVSADPGSGLEVRGSLAAVDVVTGELTAWDPRPNSAVRALAFDGSHVFAGGEFTSLGGVTRKNLAALDLVSGLPTAWNPAGNVQGTVAALAVSGSSLYVGGTFRFTFPVPNDTAAVRYNLTGFDLVSGEPTAWYPNETANYYEVSHQTIATLAASSSTIYVGGRFTRLAGQTRNYLGAFDGVTGELSDWNPSANDSVTVIAVKEDTVYVGGTFNHIGGLTRNGLAALGAVAHDSTDGITTAWDPNPCPPSNPDPGGNPSTGVHYSSGTIHAIDASGSTVYVGGSFDFMGGCPAQGGVLRHSLAELDGTTGVATAWDAGLVSPLPGFFLDVSTMVVNGGAVYVGGEFATIGGHARANLAALDAETAVPTGWNPGPDGGVSALLVDGPSAVVYAGGGFRSIGGLPQSGIAAMGDLSTPTLVALMSADAMPGHVLLAWYSPRGVATATVYRRTSTSDWNAIATIVGDGAGRLAYEDTHVSAGTRYGYRLGVVSHGIEAFLGETWVDVPPALGFALTGPRPNPSAGEVSAVFSLPDATPARLELMDIAGRRIATRDVGALGAGNHIVPLAPGHPLPGGVYLLRLTRGGHSLSARVIVLR